MVNDSRRERWDSFPRWKYEFFRDGVILKGFTSE